MDAEDILNEVIRGTLGGRRKRHRGTLGALAGGRLLNARNLLTAAGLAWGVYEATRSQTTAAAPAPDPSPLPKPSATPPPIPSPTASAARPSASPDDGLRRLVRLAISAARADGNLSLEERGRIQEQAERVGLGDDVAAELQQPRPLAEIVAGVGDPKLRADLYTLAFTIVRADETVSGAERVYLAQLAAKLGLPPEATARLEAEAVAQIEGAKES